MNGWFIISQHINENTLIYEILDELAITANLEKQIIIINKECGLFEINLKNAKVYFTPNRCFECSSACFKKREICIVLADESCPGWTNIRLSHLELLLLSKSIALEHDCLPSHVQTQITNKISCSPSNLHDALMAELRAVLEARRRKLELERG